jgi:hypothetical protein
MSLQVAACNSQAMAGSCTELFRMVSMAVQAVPNSFLFPFPFLKPVAPVRKGIGGEGRIEVRI